LPVVRCNEIAQTAATAAATRNIPMKRHLASMDIFGSCDLNLDLMTFIYELDPYPQEMYQMSEDERPTSRLS